jgi:hypothetical protein
MHMNITVFVTAGISYSSKRNRLVATVQHRTEVGSVLEYSTGMRDVKRTSFAASTNDAVCPAVQSFAF